MENPDLVLQETGSSPTHSRLNYVPSGDTLRRDAISSYKIFHQIVNCGDNLFKWNIIVQNAITVPLLIQENITSVIVK